MGPFALEAVVDETPGDAADAGGEVGYYGGHDGAEVGAQCGASVELGDWS